MYGVNRSDSGRYSNQRKNMAHIPRSLCWGLKEKPIRIIAKNIFLKYEVGDKNSLYVGVGEMVC